jgi:hypothetical protein
MEQLQCAGVFPRLTTCTCGETGDDNDLRQVTDIPH